MIFEKSLNTNMNRLLQGLTTSTSDLLR